MDKLIVLAIAGMGGLGLFFAVILAIANQKLKVEEDPKIEGIEKLLPGINCGACGFLSCHDYAVRLAGQGAPVDSCKPGGEAAQKALAAFLGVEARAGERKTAVVHCAADSKTRKKKAVYSGMNTCAGAALVKGADAACDYGCLGFGDCFAACPFGAIEMVDGLPRIIAGKCVACGKCVSACPRRIISLETPDEKKGLVYVACNSLDRGPETRKVCQVGCIACGICAKMSDNAFIVENNLSKPAYEKIKGLENLNDIMLKCPTKVIKENR
ncbi:MAG: RnfABCDGE type electron transport complex subunit B [Candidatus Omnitrophota bacterium]